MKKKYISVLEQKIEQLNSHNQTLKKSNDLFRKILQNSDISQEKDKAVVDKLETLEKDIQKVMDAQNNEKHIFCESSVYKFNIALTCIYAFTLLILTINHINR